MEASDADAAMPRPPPLRSLADACVAIIVHPSRSLVASGMTQQSYFLLRAMQALGAARVDVFHAAGTDTARALPFAGGGTDVVTRPLAFPASGDADRDAVAAVAAELAGYHLVLWASVSPQWPALHAVLRERGTRSIAFECGSALVYDEAAWTAPGAGLQALVSNAALDARCDGAWVIPHMAPSHLAYFRILNGGSLPVRTVPHVWSPEILAADNDLAVNAAAVSAWRATAPEPLDPPPRLALLERAPCAAVDGVRRGALVLIMESHMTDRKTALLPLLAADALYRRDPAAISEVRVYCAPSRHADGHEPPPATPGAALWSDLLSSLAVGPLVKSLPRNSFVDVARGLARDPRPVVLLSHQIAHDRNFVIYDAMYCGIAVACNSRALAAARVGVWTYDKDDVDGARAALAAAIAGDGVTLSARRAMSRAWLFAECNPCARGVVAQMGAAVRSALDGADGADGRSCT